MTDEWRIQKCLRNSMNRIQSKDQGIGAYETNKTFLTCFDDKIYILNNGYDGLSHKNIIFVLVTLAFLFYLFFSLYMK